MHLNLLSLGVNIYSSKCIFKSTFKNYGNKLSSTVFNDVYVKFTPLERLLLKSLPRSFLLVVTEASGGGGVVGTQQIFRQGGSTPRSNPLPFTCIYHFSRKRYPFRTPSIDKWYPFHIQSTPHNSNLQGKSRKVQVIGSSSYW